VLDPTGTYRYRLERGWAPSKGTVTWIMLNPSTADADLDDATIRRCIGFTERWGLGLLVVVNLFGLRATLPEVLYGASDPVGPLNDTYLRTAVEEADTVVVAWGAHGRYKDRATQVATMFSDQRLYCLGRTNDGQPRHPLRIPYTQPLELWRPA
jgi:hypothetical protein